MAHSKQAQKRVRQNAIHAERNKATASGMRTFFKRCMAAVEAGDKAQAEALLMVTMRHIDKAANRNVIHVNAANRKKRQVMSAVHKMA
jgi:small subunit ribosomal protein S20